MTRTNVAEWTSDMNLVVENANWGGVTLGEIHTVLKSASDVLLDAFGTRPEASVRVTHWGGDPLVCYDKRPYRVYLSARDTYWCQYVYQFSHELCHIMTNFDEYRGHRHKWFEESLCEMASLFVLHRLVDAWAKGHGPYRGVDFAPNHGTYASRVEERYRPPPASDLRGWLDSSIRDLEACADNRALNGVVAVVLLDRFQRDPTLWRDCASLDHWDPHADATFSDYLHSWAERLRGEGSEARVPILVRDIFALGR